MKHIIAVIILVCMLLMTSCNEGEEKAGRDGDIILIPQYNSFTNSITLMPMYMP